MFARAAIIGRVTRERAEAHRTFLANKEELKRRTPVAPLRQRCFIPMMKVPCFVLGLAAFLITCGAVMCNYAFHAKRLSSTTYVSYNTTEVVINQPQYQLLWSFTYIGPSFMGLGIFIIIIACVVLLDKRDKIIKDYIHSMIATQQEISMELSYRATTPSKPIRPATSKPVSSADDEGKLEDEDIITCLIPTVQQKPEHNNNCTTQQSLSERDRSADFQRSLHDVEEAR